MIPFEHEQSQFAALVNPARNPKIETPQITIRFPGGTI
jgi:hypothetical protein